MFARVEEGSVVWTLRVARSTSLKTAKGISMADEACVGSAKIVPP